MPYLHRLSPDCSKHLTCCLLGALGAFHVACFFLFDPPRTHVFLFFVLFSVFVGFCQAEGLLTYTIHPPERVVEFIDETGNMVEDHELDKKSFLDVRDRLIYFRYMFALIWA